MPSPGPRPATLGTSGNRNGYQEHRCSRTTREASPWWEVDLGHVQSLASIQLWRAMTYHEHPKHRDGQPPVKLAATRSTSASAPLLYVLVSSEPLSRSGAQAFSDAKASASGVVVRPVYADADARVVSVSLSDDDASCVGRYVRLQHASTSSVLHFAELEIFGAAPSGDGLHQQCDDGFYGVDSALDGDVHVFVDSDWLVPSSSLVDVRFWIGGFQAATPALQWLDPSVATESVVIELEHHRRVDAGASAGVWTPVTVDARSSALLDRESTEVVAAIAAAAKDTTVDLARYVNSHTLDVGVVSSPGVWLDQLAWLSDVDPALKIQLQRKVETQTFASRSTILAYGERRRSVLFVRSGTIAVVGPGTSIGAKTLGTLQPGALVNELGLFGVWPQQVAAFQAADNISGAAVECECLSFQALVDVLGAAFVASVRARVIRTGAPSSLSHQATPTTTSGPAVHYTDATRAQVFRTKVPASALATGAAALTHRLRFRLFAYERALKARGASLGAASLLLSQLSAHGEGSVTLPISIDSAVVGQLTLAYVVIKPFVHAANTLARVWRSYWRPRAPLNVGHRGMGRSFHQVAGYRHALTRENTLASFILAGQSGADFVEFDVQLTRDRVPVLYHDFVLRVGLEDQHAWTLGSRAEPHDVGIHDLTLRQLQRSHTAPATRSKAGAPTNVLHQRVRKHWSQVVRQSHRTAPRPTVQIERPSVRETDESHLVDFFPTLEALLKHVPSDIGLNVEIKYPDNLWRTAMRHSAPFAMNAYVDAILACVFTHAGAHRRIFFSCFDATLCVLLRAKQARYPVLFLTYGSIQPQAFDARMTLQFAIKFVELERLNGIVSNSDAFLTNPELVGIVKNGCLTKTDRDAQSTVLLTWGDQNTNHASVQLQKQHAIDGVISDNIGDLTRRDATLRQAQEQQASQ